MTEIQKFKCRAILDSYTPETQRRQLVEECAELIQAVTKAERASETSDYPAYRATISHLIEEIADVEVMLQQIKSLYNAEASVKLLVEQKIDRQLSRIKSEAAPSATVSSDGADPEGKINASASKQIDPAQLENFSSLENL